MIASAFGGTLEESTIKLAVVLETLTRQHKKGIQCPKWRFGGVRVRPGRKRRRLDCGEGGQYRQ
jgi:hypothetical protein